MLRDLKACPKRHGSVGLRWSWTPTAAEISASVSLVQTSPANAAGTHSSASTKISAKKNRLEFMGKILVVNRLAYFEHPVKSAQRNFQGLSRLCPPSPRPLKSIH